MQVVTELSPPAQTLVDDQVAGTVTERVRAILDAANLSAEFRMYPWARAYNLTLSRANTLIYAMARTPVREQHFHWIAPVGEYRLGLLRLRSNQHALISTLDDAKALVTAVQREDVAVEYLATQGFEEGKSLLITADITASWELLLKGKVDFIVEDPDAMQGMLEQFAVSASQVDMVYLIPQLAQTTWLAASLNTDRQLVERLQNAAAAMPH
ncbi:transporter substrate-binding domain-containing protein [Lacimicrobium sp. SS2-24]|uniref:substrate-binding periplasmic protein n=1 Tax=Lacimicrobium sp. SS2-24 TaxID=2005569 RepID=UPI00143BB6B5|nr:transporter substrate-binding domain-containing protein [Lacimicrobium sp. SS2-24]